MTLLFVQATRPLQEALAMNIEDEWKVNKIARLLPPPLYMVYANLTAFAEACDPQLSATINGDEFEANQLDGSSAAETDAVSQPSSKTTPDEDEAMESDNEDDERRPTKKSHHHRRQSKAVQRENQRERLFKPHPLSVTFRIQSRTPNSSSLSVTLQYLTALNIVTAKCGLLFDGPTPTDGIEVVSATTILNALSSGDLGVDSCNPKTHFQLQELDLDPATFAILLEAKDLGKPYRWAQQLCGLDFVSTTSNGGVSLQLTQAAVPQILRQIRSRWQNRLELMGHLQKLTRSRVSTPSNSSTGLVKWQPITYEEFVGQPASQRLVHEQLVNREDLMYSAVVARGAGARLECAVRVSVRHPADGPLWTITLHRKTDLWTAQLNATVRVSVARYLFVYFIIIITFVWFFRRWRPG